MANGIPGQAFTLTLNFFDSVSGVLVDPTGAITLDITYGSMVGLVPDTSGPFTYAGGSTPSTTNIYKVSTGVYALNWVVPQTAQQGVYVANWSVVYGANTFLVTEDFVVTGGWAPPVPSADTGYWTGSLSYTAPYGTVTVPLGSTDTNGTTWLLKKVEGWDGAPTVGQVIQRSGDHGGWPTQQNYGPRILTLTVQASAPTQALRDVARAQLNQAVPINDTATFVYNEPTPKQVQVRLNGSAHIAETYLTLTDVEFTVPLVAPDPRKYGTQLKSAAVNALSSIPVGVILPITLPVTFPTQPTTPVIPVTNAGTFECRPVITIAGPLVGPGITNLSYGQTISYQALTLAANDVLVVDLNARQGFLNGAFVPATISSSWWVLQPGQNLVQVLGTTTGGGSATVQWSDSYL
jgi:hypothetical protein